MPECQTEPELNQWARQYLANLSTEIDVLTKLLELSTKLNQTSEANDDLGMRSVRKEQSRIGLLVNELRRERTRLQTERCLLESESESGQDNLESNTESEILAMETHRSQLLTRIKQLNNQSVVLLKDQIVKLHSQLKSFQNH